MSVFHFLQRHRYREVSFLQSGGSQGLVAPEPPGGLIETQIAGPAPRVSDPPGVWLENLCF